MNNGLLSKFLSKVTKHDNGCWNWNSNFFGGVPVMATAKSGGLENASTRTLSALRLSFCHFVRPITKSEKVERTCKNMRCVNPEHLIAKHINRKLIPA